MRVDEEREMLDTAAASASRPCRRRQSRHGCSRWVAVHRYYDPATGQFLSVDPMVNETGAPYFYAGDNPVNQNDPTGLSAPSNPACSGSGPIGASPAQLRQLCQAELQNAKKVTSQELTNDAASDPRVHIIDIAGDIASFVATHRTAILIVGAAGLAVVSLAAGTVAAGSLIGVLSVSDTAATAATATAVVSGAAGSGLDAYGAAHSTGTLHELAVAGAVANGVGASLAAPPLVGVTANPGALVLVIPALGTAADVGQVINYFFAGGH